MLQNDPELHGGGDFDRVHGISLFSVWIIPISGGDAVYASRGCSAPLWLYSRNLSYDNAVLADLKPVRQRGDSKWSGRRVTPLR